MTEREEFLLKAAKERLCSSGYCDDDCSYYRFGAYDCIECAGMNDEAINIVKNIIIQHDALFADLHAVCAGKFVDICCICGHYQPDKEGELKCELNGLICRWVWRGVQKRENEKDVQP